MTKFKRRPIVGTLSDDEIRLVRETPAGDYKEVRSKLVCCLLLDGVHREELINIALPDLRLHLNTIRVPGGIATISKHTTTVIWDWLEVRYARSDVLNLFTSKHGRALQWHKDLDERGRVFWSKKTVGRPVTCNEFLSAHVKEIRMAHPHLTIRQISELCRISPTKGAWLLGFNFAANHYLA